jgi:hypothetical protein
MILMEEEEEEEEEEVVVGVGVALTGAKPSMLPWGMGT